MCSAPYYWVDTARIISNLRYYAGIARIISPSILSRVTGGCQPPHLSFLLTEFWSTILPRPTKRSAYCPTIKVERRFGGALVILPEAPQRGAE